MAARIHAGHMPAIRPSWGDTYWAVFPAGYPAAIAFFQLFFGDALIASKLLNGCLLLGTIVLYTRWLRLPMLPVAALFFCAWMVEIATYSWSENLFIFAMALSVSSLARYLQTGRSHRLWLYGLGLLLLVFSRYMGGMLLATYLLALALYLRRSHSRHVLAIFGMTALVGLLFGGYLYFNLQTTGYPTGMYRSAAPESFVFLSAQFAGQLLLGLGMMLPAVLLLCTGGRQENKRALPEQAKLLLLMGGAYLALLFALRMQMHFEQFTGRMLWPGVLLLGLALLKTAAQNWPKAEQKNGLLRVGFVLLALVNMGVLYMDIFTHPEIRQDSRHKALSRYEHKYGALPDGTIIISAGYINPTIGWHMLSPLLGSDRLFYAVRDNYDQPLAQYQHYLFHLRYHKQPPAQYVFDFTEFPSTEKFDSFVAARRIDPAFAKWLRGYFQPARFVVCEDCKPQ